MPIIPKRSIINPPKNQTETTREVQPSKAKPKNSLSIINFNINIVENNVVIKPI